MTDGLMSWQPRSTASSTQLGVTQSAGCYPNLTTRSRNLYRQRVMPEMDLTDHLVAGTERQLKPNTSPHHLALEAERKRLRDTRTTYDRTGTTEPVIPDQSMDQEGVHQREKTTIKPSATSTTSPRPKTAYGLHLNCVVMSPDTEGLHTPYASPMR